MREMSSVTTPGASNLLHDTSSKPVRGFAKPTSCIKTLIEDIFHPTETKSNKMLIRGCHW